MCFLVLGSIPCLRSTAATYAAARLSESPFFFFIAFFAVEKLLYFFLPIRIGIVLTFSSKVK
jgi:hypothetical protein